MQERQKHLYQFGDFQIDINERVLISQDRAIALAPKVFDTLFLLVENRGYILEKSEILEKIWPDTFVEEGNLAIYISQIRKVLGDTAANPQFIETVPKRGYRFIAPVSELAPSEQTAITTNSTEQLSQQSDYQFEPPRNQNERRRPHSEQFIQRGSEVQTVTVKEVSAGLYHYPDISTQTIVTQSTAVSTQSATDQAKIIARPTPRNRLKLAVITAISLVLLLTSLSLYRSRQSVRASHFQSMELTRLTNNSRVGDAAISPDGKYVVYTEQLGDRAGLWLRQADSSSAIQLIAPTTARFLGITFNPAGTKIYYVAIEKDQRLGVLYEIPFFGGAPLKIVKDVDSRITFSPDGSEFAFVRMDQTSRESILMVAKLNGVERELARRKFANPFSLDGPAWSPDGKKIAIAVGKVDLGNPNMTVNIVDAATATIEPLGNRNWSRNWSWIGTVSWLKDGSGLVMPGWQQEASSFTDQLWYLSYPAGQWQRVTNDLDRYSIAGVAADTDALVTIQHTRQSRLSIISTATAAETTQISSGFGDIYSEWFGLNWLPDGRIIYGSNSTGNTDLWILDPASRQQQQLTRDIHGDLTPRVSSDGRYLIYCSYQSGIPHIYGMELDGANLKQLTNGRGETRPDISADGSWFVYTSIGEDKRTIWQQSFDGSAPIQLSERDSYSSVISPDGKSVAYCQFDRARQAISVKIVPKNGGAPSQSFDDLAISAGSLIEWLPDGSGIAYVSSEREVANIWIKPVNGDPIRQLTNFTADEIYRFAFSRDGKQLACERGRVISDLVLIKKI